MSNSTAVNSTAAPLNRLIAGDLHVGEPDVAGALAVFPIFGPDPTFHYASFADARAHGAEITELEAGASVGNLLVHNPTPLPFLLYEGEEVLGAQQNRTIDVSVLAASGRKTQIPVSCVEAGRWDGRRHGESFERAPQAAYPALRRAKAAQVRERARLAMEPRAEQGEVWDELSRKSARMGAASATGAMHDVYESRRDGLYAMQGEVSCRERQLGMVAAIGGRIIVLDWVSRSEVFSTLHAPLVQGYALDALEFPSPNAPAPPSVGEIEGFLSLALDNAPAPTRAIGLGNDLRFAGHGAEGAGLAVDEELVQLTAFPNENQGPQPSGAAARAGRIRRPSQRRA